MSRADQPPADEELPTGRPAAGAPWPPAGGGELTELCREFDWGDTALGPVAGWSPELCTVVRTCLESPFPSNVWCGPEHVVVYNDGYRRLLGGRHPAALGRPVRTVWPEIWGEIEPMIARIERGGEPTYAEDAPFVVERAGEREEVWFTFSLSPVRDGSGAIIALLNVVAETTGRLLAERAAERAEAQLREVFAQAPAFLAVMHGPEHVFHFVNDAYLRLVGHRDLVGRRVTEALPEVVGQGFVELLDGVLGSGRPFVGRETAVWLTRSPGEPAEERFVDFVYQPLVDSATGRRAGIAAHGFDVTEQVLARRQVERLLGESERARRALEEANVQLEQQQVELELTAQQLQENAIELEAQTEALDQANARLRASEERLRDVLRQAPIAIAVLEGPEHVYTIVSPHYAQTPGGGRPLLGRTVRGAFPELEGQGYVERMDEVYRTGRPFAAHEQPVLLDRDGDGVVERYFYDLGYQPLRDAAGDVYAIVSAAHDVTDRVRSRHEVELAREAAEVARRQAEEANRAKSEFLATMSHELRTPLNAIAGYADLLLLGVRGELTERQRGDVERMRRSGHHLLALINDVLNFAKLEAGQVEFRIGRVQLCAVLDGLEDLIRPQVEAQSLSYRHDGCAPTLWVSADPEKVRQVLLNLLANAVKFTDPGGSVALHCDVDDHWVRVHVSDTGRGIGAVQLRSIFDPFVQVDRHLTPASQQGVGLGLSISRDLAQAMGGSLTATSREGVGSTFTLALPRLAPEPVADEPTTDEPTTDEPTPGA